VAEYLDSWFYILVVCLCIYSLRFLILDAGEQVFNASAHLSNTSLRLSICTCADVQATVEDDGNSEEREFPKIRGLSELYGTPEKFTEVCRPVISNLADKSEAAEQPEKQRHQAKRGLQEPPEPSHTIKRLKGNGRNGVVPQTNQDQENGR
jgi:hypothetical protein